MDAGIQIYVGVNAKELDQFFKDIDKKFKPLQDASKKATNALTSLSLVAQDLPFGFIGIQNNLPRVIQTFGELSQESGGVKNAVKQLATGLVGPAGLFLAFSAVTAGITFAIQKYGSLSKAIDAVIFSGRTLTKEQQEIVKGVAEEGTKVITLFGLYQNLADSRDKQIKIIQILKQTSSEYFGNLDEEKTKINGITKAIDDYINSFIGKIYIENQQKKITELIAKYAEKISFVIDKQIEVDNETKKTNKTLQYYGKELDNIGKKQANVGDIKLEFKAPNVKKTTDEVLGEYRDAIKTGAEKIFQNIGKFKQFLNLDDLFGFKSEKGKTDFEKQIGDELESITNFSNISFRLANRRLGSEFNTVNRTLAERLAESRKIIDKGVEIPKKLFRFPEIVKSDEIELAIGNLKLFSYKLEEVQLLLNSTFFQPLENAFVNLFETGQFGFKSFADAVLKQIKQLVAKIIATGIISLIANLATGGFGAAKGGFAGGIARVGKDIAAALGLGGRKEVNPNFGGLQGGGFGLTGQVIFRQSGSDLVGVLNRTNATINRVG